MVRKKKHNILSVGLYETYLFRIIGIEALYTLLNPWNGKLKQ